MVGFIEAEGCFFVVIIKSNTHDVGYQVQLKFKITQHSRDELLLKSFIEFLVVVNIIKNLKDQ